MKHVVLSDGRWVGVSINHLPGYPRRTTVALRADGSSLVEATARCSLQDNFCRRTGRKIAANKLLAVMRNRFYPKVDRESVFQAIYPEYSPAPERRSSQ